MKFNKPELKKIGKTIQLGCMCGILVGAGT